jgi:hypothetical protein
MELILVTNETGNLLADFHGILYSRKNYLFLLYVQGKGGPMTCRHRRKAGVY